MIPNRSPWLHQLNRTRPVVPLDRDVSADVAIVGGGIAGVVTAFFTLRDTDKSVVLLEADKVAHGATGHNAGQLATYFERSFAELVRDFGLPMAALGQKQVESAWGLLDAIVSDAGLTTPIYRFTGYAGYATLDSVLALLSDNRLRVEGGLPAEAIFIAKEWELIDQIPEEYQSLYSTIAHEDLLALLEVRQPQYIAASAYQKGCMNSALFSEEIVRCLMETYADRFSLFEGSPARTVRLQEFQAIVHASNHAVTAGRVVLCTNGFENFDIVNEAGSDINTQFHHLISGRIGYMAGYIEPMNSAPVAISYYPDQGAGTGDPTGEAYYYLTRRPHEHENGDTHNLVCAGGPDKVLPNQALYSKEDDCSPDMHESIDGFLKESYQHFPNEEERMEYAFCWHGLMGYTPTGVRRIGPEPCNPVLLYNLGCNGVGIMPSLFGGKRIAEFLNGETPEETIFDPLDHRCVID